MSKVLPVSAIVPTRNRAAALGRMLRSLGGQSVQPAEVVVVDASPGYETKAICEGPFEGLETSILYRRAVASGAIEQRNQAMAFASQGAILFLDDDILFEQECIERLWQALQGDASVGGVNALITNQRYSRPGALSRTLFWLLHGRREESYAGKCIGPACNLLPEDREDLPAVVEVEWLNTTCTLYRREALPNPPFISEHVGRQILLPAFPIEDMALSLRVRKLWRLANARTARIYHDSQPGIHKQDVLSMSKIELLNRHYVMTRLLGRRGLADYLRLFLFEAFSVTSSLAAAQGWRRLPAVLFGKVSAITFLITRRGALQGLVSPIEGQG